MKLFLELKLWTVRPLAKVIIKIIFIRMLVSLYKRAIFNE